MGSIRKVGGHLVVLIFGLFSSLPLAAKVPSLEHNCRKLITMQLENQTLKKSPELQELYHVLSSLEKGEIAEIQAHFDIGDQSSANDIENVLTIFGFLIVEARKPVYAKQLILFMNNHILFSLKASKSERSDLIQMIDELSELVAQLSTRDSQDSTVYMPLQAELGRAIQIIDQTH